MNLQAYNSSLSPQGAEAISHKLDILLADYEVFRENLKHLHWDPSYRSYLEFSPYIARLRENIGNSGNLIAERIIQLGATPSAVDERGLYKARLTPVEFYPDFDDATQRLIGDLRGLLQGIGETFELAASYEDTQTLGILNAIGRHIILSLHHLSAMRFSTLN